MGRWAGRAVALFGVALLLVPVGHSGGPWSGCGPAVTAMVGLTEPSDEDRFIPVQAGADFGVSAAVQCQGRAFDRVRLGVPLAVVGTVAATWHRRARRRSVGRTSSAVPAAAR
jgi:hypothetical protein